MHEIPATEAERTSIGISPGNPRWLRDDEVAQQKYWPGAAQTNIQLMPPASRQPRQTSYTDITRNITRDSRFPFNLENSQELEGNKCAYPGNNDAQTAKKPKTETRDIDRDENRSHNIPNQNPPLGKHAVDRTNGRGKPPAEYAGRR